MSDHQTNPDETAPRKVTVDDQTVEGHSLREQLDAADRKDANTVTNRGRLGIRFNRMYPRGAV